MFFYMLNGDDDDRVLSNLPQEYDNYNDNPPFLGWQGHCPECGGWLTTVGGNYADEPQFDECESCGWVSDVEY